MDFCAFGYLISSLSKRRLLTLYGLLKAVQEDWNKISFPISQKALLTNKLRPRMIVKNRGYEIEYLKHKYECNIFLTTSSKSSKKCANIFFLYKAISF